MTTAFPLCNPNLLGNDCPGHSVAYPASVSGLSMCQVQAVPMINFQNLCTQQICGLQICGECPSAALKNYVPNFLRYVQMHLTTKIVCSKDKYFSRWAEHISRGGTRSSTETRPAAAGAQRMKGLFPSLHNPKRVCRSFQRNALNSLGYTFQNNSSPRRLDACDATIATKIGS